MGDYLRDWSRDWDSRSVPDPDIVQHVWALRGRGLSYAEIAGDLGITPAAAYRVAELRKEYEDTPDPINTIAHLLNTTLYNLSHAVLHIQQALDTQGAERQFNIEHVDKHLKEVQDHADHLQVALRRKFPEIGKEFDRVTKAAHFDKR